MLSLKRFGKYSVVGFTTFIFDMVLLVTAVSFGVPYYAAVAGSFLIAVSINYAISRRYVFIGTSRQWHHGFFYFIGLALSGAAMTTGSVVFLAEIFKVHYLIGRTIVGAVISLINYFINLRFNFKVNDKDPNKL